MPRPTPRSGPPATRTMARPGSGGLTLLEMMIVLVLLGVVLALSVPALVSPRPGYDDPLQRVLDTARSAAVRRAEALTLTMDGDGRWVIGPADPSDPETIGSGRLERSPASGLRVTISPLGACWIEGPVDVVAQRVADPVRCRLARATRS
jgi:prepilin-type N-terminal cleavage/methylation domain-containing protein